MDDTTGDRVPDRTLAGRVAGALVGMACGDALGAPHEFRAPLDPDRPAVLGDGGERFPLGRWTDDTAMASAVLRAAGTAGLGTVDGLDAVAEQFSAWVREDGRGIGQQTLSVVLGAEAARRRSEQRGEPPARQGAAMTQAAQTYQRRKPDAAGNGALMRTAAVAVTCLDDRQELARRVRAVACLTHAHPLAGDSAVLWSEGIRLAVTRGRTDVGAGLDLLPEARREQWGRWVDEALSSPPSVFTPNGWTVTAFQAALASVTHTSRGPAQYVDGVQAAIHVGNDTDTVAAIAGALLGARWGVDAVPREWRDAVHGWPGWTCAELGGAARRAAGLQSGG